MPEKTVVVAAIIFECKQGIPIISGHLCMTILSLSCNCGLCTDTIFDMTLLCYCKKFEQQILANYWYSILQFLLSLQALAKN